MTGTLFFTGCSLLIDAQLEERGSSSGSGGGGGGAIASSSSSVYSSSFSATASVGASTSTSTSSASTSAAQSSSASGGGCGSVCMLANATSACVAGQCVITACDSNFADCDLDPATGCEINLNNDPDHCGSCTHTCGGDKCSGSKCK